MKYGFVVKAFEMKKEFSFLTSDIAGTCRKKLVQISLTGFYIIAVVCCFAVASGYS